MAGKIRDDRLPPHLRDLLKRNVWPHPVDNIELIETHISWVILTGDWAYKIKKPVALDFLDFSTLDSRRRYCFEEIRINSLYAPHLYDRVVNICDNNGQLSIDGSGDVVEYAVRMHQFPANAHVITNNGQMRAPSTSFGRFGHQLGQLHESASMNCHNFGQPRDQIEQVDKALAGLEQSITDPLMLDLVHAIANWCNDIRSSIERKLSKRRDDARVRECHGDLHLGNVILNKKSNLVAFDALEFDPALRWTDVCADVAFLAMDLEARGHYETAQAFVAGWLEQTGDYDALQVLRYFKVYRALIRARVASLSPDNNESNAQLDFKDQPPQNPQIMRYLALASEYIKHPSTPTLYVMRGLSGSGKSWLAERLAGPLNAIWIRSDVERKRGADDAIKQCSDYTNAGRAGVYESMHDTATNILDAGFNVLLDATYSDDKACTDVRMIAERLRCNFLIIHTVAPLGVLETRIQLRQLKDDDPSDATTTVLHHQRKAWKELSPTNEAHELRLDTTQPVQPFVIAKTAQAVATVPGHNVDIRTSVKFRAWPQSSEMTATQTIHG